MSTDPPLAPFTGRLERAKQIIRDLTADVQKWAASTPLQLVGNIREDRLQFTVTLEVKAQPPLEQWAYRFGEAVHQLRAALENYLVSIARESGVTESKDLRRIQFPIAASSKEWKESASRIANLPQPVRAVIQQVQPFNRGESPAALRGDPLLLLRDLSNRDKHQARVITTMVPAQLQQAAAVEFETEEGAAASVPPDVRINVPSFETGGILYQQTTKGRIAKVTGTFNYHLQVCMEMPDGPPIEVALSSTASVHTPNSC